MKTLKISFELRPVSSHYAGWFNFMSCDWDAEFMVLECPHCGTKDAQPAELAREEFVDFMVTPSEDRSAWYYTCIKCETTTVCIEDQEFEGRGPIHNHLSGARPEALL